MKIFLLFLFTLSPIFSAFATDTQLLIIGGGNLTGLEIFKGKTVMVISWASKAYPAESYDAIRTQLLAAGAHATIPSFLPPTTPDEVKTFLKEYAKADATSFSGGDQTRLVKPFHDFSELLAALEKHFQAGEPVEGSSAGAAAMAVTMITGNKTPAAQGLGLFSNPQVRIDTHFDERNRQERLIQFMRDTNAQYGIGLGKHTGLFIINERRAFVVGPATVEFFTLPPGGPGVVQQTLRAGDSFSLEEWKKTP